jgi:hypothetical protein
MKRHLWMTMTILASIVSGASALAADSAGELLKSYQSAHNANSIELVQKLVHFRTQDPTQRAAWLKEVAGTFSSRIAKITLIPFEESASKLPESELKRLPAALKPVNWLAVELAPQPSDTGRTESTHYLVAVENGKYFIVGP